MSYTTKILTTKGGCPSLVIDRNDGVRRSLTLTKQNLLDLQIQISNFMIEQIKEDELRKQADKIILDKDPFFVKKENEEREYTYKENTFEVKCGTSSERRIWMFDIKDNKLEYKKYEGDFK